MSDINEIKRLIEESEGLELSNWNTATHAQREAWASIETQGRAWIIDFITTIESQKEEIKRLQWAASNAFDNLNQLKSIDVEEAKQFLYKVLTDPLSFTQEIESLKAITELAVKTLQFYANKDHWRFDDTQSCIPMLDIEYELAVATISKIERLQNGSTS